LGNRKKNTMRIIGLTNIYEGKVYVIDEKKLIVKLDCLCPDFQFRRIKKVGELNDIKYFALPCKHLKPIVEALEKQGYKLKVPEEMVGLDKLTPKLKQELLERANYKCEADNCKEVENLEIHRKTRKSNGGKYNKKNCSVLCNECHKTRHRNEF